MATKKTLPTPTPTPKDSVIINGVEYVKKPDHPTTITPSYQPFVIVRCRNAGVHAGSLISRKDGQVTLHNSRRLWRWWSQATLSELAVFGPRPDKIEEQKYACVLPILVLTESDVCEVIHTTVTAQEGIWAVPIWGAS